MSACYQNESQNYHWPIEEGTKDHMNVLWQHNSKQLINTAIFLFLTLLLFDIAELLTGFPAVKMLQIALPTTLMKMFTQTMYTMYRKDNNGYMLTCTYCLMRLNTLQQYVTTSV